jgi:hypothetical protein
MCFVKGYMHVFFKGFLGIIGNEITLFFKGLDYDLRIMRQYGFVIKHHYISFLSIMRQCRLP